MLSPPKFSKVVSDQATQHAERLMDSLPPELLSFIQHLRPLFRVEVFDSFCFLLTGLLVGVRFARDGTRIGLCSG